MNDLALSTLPIPYDSSGISRPRAFIWEVTGLVDYGLGRNISVDSPSVGAGTSWDLNKWKQVFRRKERLGSWILGGVYTSSDKNKTSSTIITRITTDDQLASSRFIETPLDFRKAITNCFANARDETFEDGMENSFRVGLDFLLKQYPNECYQELWATIAAPSTNSDLATEALKLLGDIVDASTVDLRRTILEKSLSNNSVIVRDAALVGLASMNNPKSIPALESALASETVRELRNDIQDVLNLLKGL